MLSNSDVTMTIYYMGRFVKEIFLTSFTPHNITQEFTKIGVYSLNSNIFLDEDFLPYMLLIGLCLLRVIPNSNQKNNLTM